MQNKYLILQTSITVNAGIRQTQETQNGQSVINCDNYYVFLKQIFRRIAVGKMTFYCTSVRLCLFDRKQIHTNRSHRCPPRKHPHESKSSQANLLHWTILECKRLKTDSLQSQLFPKSSCPYGSKDFLHDCNLKLLL